MEIVANEINTEWGSNQKVEKSSQKDNLWK